MNKGSRWWCLCWCLLCRAWWVCVFVCSRHSKIVKLLLLPHTTTTCACALPCLRPNTTTPTRPLCLSNSPNTPVVGDGCSSGKSLVYDARHEVRLRSRSPSPWCILPPCSGPLLRRSRTAQSAFCVSCGRSGVVFRIVRIVQWTFYWSIILRIYSRGHTLATHAPFHLADPPPTFTCLRPLSQAAAAIGSAKIDGSVWSIDGDTSSRRRHIVGCGT